MTDTNCIRCGQAKYECHSAPAPYASKPTAAHCDGYANVMTVEGPVYQPGGGSSGGGGSSDDW